LPRQQPSLQFEGPHDCRPQTWFWHVRETAVQSEQTCPPTPQAVSPAPEKQKMALDVLPMCPQHPVVQLPGLQSVIRATHANPGSGPAQ
jgi:hypothetical protein